MWHARQRAWERYNKYLGRYAYNQIINSLRNKEYLFVCDSKEDPNKHFVYVKFENIPYKVLFIDDENPKIITVYPLDVDEYNQLVEDKKIQKYIEYLNKRGFRVTDARIR